MRRSLIAITLLLAAMMLMTGTAAAQEETGGGNGESGGDRSATGELLGDETAEVVARESGDLGAADTPRRGGGNVVCRFYDDASGELVDLYSLSPDVNGPSVVLLRMCEDTTTGEYVSIDIVTVAPPLVPEPDPRDLALMARSRLPLPLPEARTSPEGDQTVNLETWLWVENWREESRSATAGGVTAVVVATPVEQHWTFGAPGEREVCADAGRPYDLSRQPSEQSTTCGYTFRHSSAGQPGDVFQVKATLVWHITWTSNIGASGDLGFVARTTTIPTRVAEHQALNERGSSR